MIPRIALTVASAVALAACSGSTVGTVVPPSDQGTVIEGDSGAGGSGGGSGSSSGGASNSGSSSGGPSSSGASSGGSSSGSSGGGAASSSGSGGASSGSSSGSGSSGGSSSGSGSGGSSGGSAPDAGNDPAPSTCPSGATTEQEPNDSAATANTFGGTACGAIDPVGDVDYWRMTLSAQATGIHVAYHGGVTLEVTSQGNTVTIPGAQPVPFHPGADYVIKVTGATASKESYTILVQ